MRDVAQEAGVSQALVSYVLSGRPDRGSPASPEVESRVRAAARRLNYVPDLNARSLRRRRTDRVCLVTDSVGTPWVGLVLEHLREEAEVVGYSVVSLTVDSRRGVEDTLDLLRQRVADGVVFATGAALTQELAPDLAELARLGTPVVVFSETIEAGYVDVIRAGERTAVRHALQGLVAGGRRRIAYLAHRHDLDQGQFSPRYLGYLDTLAANGLSLDGSLVAVGAAEDRVSAYEATAKLLAEEPRPDAIFSSSDRGAISAIWALRDREMAIPEHVAVLGFGDIPEGVIVRPALSTIGQDHGQLGQAAKLLFARLAGDPAAPKEVLLPCHVTWRESA